MADDTRQQANAFLGVGWSFPLRLAAAGQLAVAEHEDDIREAIVLILATNSGERVMRPDFGAGLRAFVFEPGSTATLALIRTRVEGALIDWEPRIDVLEVLVTVEVPEMNKVLIDVQYRVRATNSLHNLVYPFYLQEGAAA